MYEGGGLPPGGLLLLFGPESCGKTALALRYLYQHLQDPAACAGWVITEPEPIAGQLAWAGIPTDQLIVNYQTPELPGLAAALVMVQEGCGLVVVDSLAALLGRHPGDSLEGILGRKLGPLQAAAQATGARVIMTDQVRTVRGGETAPAGLCPALLRYVEAQLSLKVGEGLYQAGTPVGQRVVVRLIRDGGDAARWGRECQLRLDWRRGFLNPGQRAVPPGAPAAAP